MNCIDRLGIHEVGECNRYNDLVVNFGGQTLS